MNNKFKSNSPEEAKAWLTEMFAQGAEWLSGGQEINNLNKTYLMCENGKIYITGFHTWYHSNLPEYSPKTENKIVIQKATQCGMTETIMEFVKSQLEPKILTTDFSNVQVGDRVKCIMHGDGVVEEITDDVMYPILIEFNSGVRNTYTTDGRSIPEVNPTLFYHFSGQFPTAEACVRPKPDPYELHGVTREKVAQLVKAVELIAGFKPKCLTWASTGKPLFWDSEPKKEGRGWKNGRFCKAEVLRREGPYPHWQTPIVLGGK